MAVDQPHPKRRTRLILKLVSYAGAGAGALLLACLIGLAFFSDALVNALVRPRIASVLAATYPEYVVRMSDMHLSLMKNRFGIDSIAMIALDGTFSSTIGPCSLSGVKWMHLLWGESLIPGDFATAVLDVRDVVVNDQESQYGLRCGSLHVSISDSELVAEALQIMPLGDDEQFFAVSKFRRTRLRLDVPHTRVMGLSCLDLLQGRLYRTRFVQMRDLSLDVLINKEKPAARDSSRPIMPNELLFSLPATINVGGVSIENGRLNYGERFAHGAKPGIITFDSMHVIVGEISNHRDGAPPVVIRGEWMFMKAATCHILLSIPIGSPEFSYHYSGSLGRMDLSALNSFIEIAEQQRIKTGVLQSAAFDINVTAGHASGSVRAIYKDLLLAAINKKTGSERGFVDGFASFIARTFKIRRNNVPDKFGAMKVGLVKQTRTRSEVFLEFTWFALRSGVGNVVGF